ncbi:MAG TPA: glycosyltransferase family 39 protein [Candidatus Sulfotelmatobacter sp.]|nr:glycosyltransferase family 39 protein [Candidatus Sulfotelmatobacter sp.]
MDVQAHQLTAPDTAGDGRAKWWWIGLGLILLLGLLLRLKGIHDPILDHPGWRQGDTASIARNFARLQFNVMYPQTTYNGPPPHYVELELQIVPFLAASLYKLFGVHPIFGRLISIAFGLGTIGVLALFGRWLFSSRAAGLIAAFFFAVLPGSVYYGRTFTPDGAMVFFLTAALYACARFLDEDQTLAPRALARVTALLTFAYLAKPVAVVALLPLATMAWERARSGKPTRATAIGVLIVVPLLVLWLYDRRVASYAEWHWASGITQLHVLPSLRAALTHPGAFFDKLRDFATALGLFRDTIAGSLAFLLSILAFLALPRIEMRSRTLLWAWLATGIVYAYVVVTVERVDYYLLLLLPLCTLALGGALARFVALVLDAEVMPPARYAVLAAVAAVALAVLVQSRSAAAPYYRYSKATYANAVLLARTLPPGALVVIGHYGPDVQYYIDRFGWEEDPAVWTPFDEESAIAKGSRYFISIEDARLHRDNPELCAWLSRFALLPSRSAWPVYLTDPRLVRPGAQAFWRGYRRAEQNGAGRAYLDAHRVCLLPGQLPTTRKVSSAFKRASGGTTTPPRNG